MTGRLTRWVVFLLVAAYATALVVVFLAQGWLVFSGARKKGSAALFDPQHGSSIVRFRTTQGVSVGALFAPALGAKKKPYPAGVRRPALLYFYGNSSNLRGVRGRVESLRSQGIHVLAPEYVGYGISEGSPSEAGCYATADAAYDYLRSRTDVDPQRILILGHSLGGAVAIDLASRKPASGLITYGAFAALSEVAQRRYPWAPVALLQQRFASQEKIGRVTCPILMFHGAEDEVVPYPNLEKLAAAATRPVTTVTLSGAGHHLRFAGPGEEPFRHLLPFIASSNALCAPTAK